MKKYELAFIKHLKQGCLYLREKGSAMIAIWAMKQSNPNLPDDDYYQRYVMDVDINDFYALIDLLKSLANYNAVDEEYGEALEAHRLKQRIKILEQRVQLLFKENQELSKRLEEANDKIEELSDEKQALIKTNQLLVEHANQFMNKISGK